MATIPWKLKSATVPLRKLSRFRFPWNTPFLRRLSDMTAAPKLPRVPELPLTPIRVVDLTRVLAGVCNLHIFFLSLRKAP